MNWNYRLCKVIFDKGEESEEVSYEIREAYYNDDGSIWAVTDQAVGIYGDTVETAKRSYEWVGLAYQKEVIDLDTYVFAKRDSDAVDEDGFAEVEGEDFNELLKSLDKPI